MLCCTLWTVLSTVLFRPVRTALFRADEPTGVNNAVLTVHIKHDSNHVLCCVNSTYHAWYQYCFISCWIYNLFFFQGLRDYFLYYRETKKYTIYLANNLLLKTNDYTLITNNQAVATSKKCKYVFFNYRHTLSRWDDVFVKGFFSYRISFQRINFLIKLYKTK